MSVSVIVPVYNTRKYLSKCLDSIINQTYSDMEIIIVDDGSTDGSAELCDEYKKMDSRICVIHQKNLGCMHARLCGLQKSNGDYVGFVDSDDWIEPDMYQELMTMAEKKKCDIVSMGYTLVHGEERVKEDGAVFFGFYERGKNLDDLLSGMMYEEEKGPGIHSSLCSKVIRRELLLDAYVDVEENITMGEDSVIFYPCCLKAKSIFIMKEYKYNYRIHDESMCRSMNVNTILKIYSFYQHMQKIFSAYMGKYHLQRQLRKCLWRLILPWLQQIFSLQVASPYIFPYSDVNKNEIVILYGAGRVGESYYSQIVKNHYCNIVAWADKGRQNKRRGIIHPSQISNFNYDKIIIAVNDEKMAEEIIGELAILGVKEEKILWSKPLEMPFDLLLF